MTAWRLSSVLALLSALSIAGCGSSGARLSSASTAPASSPSTPSPDPVSVDESAASPRAVAADVRAAEHPQRRQFPSPAGRTLEEVAKLARSSAQVTAATGPYTPGISRYAFGVTTSSNSIVYAPSAVYLAPSPGAPAAGPFLAPADPTTVAPRFRSGQNDPDALKAIYDAQVPLPHPGVYAVLVLTRTPAGLLASSSELAVAAASVIPGVGQRPPDIATDTLASVHGDVSLLTTRTPPESMHAVSFDQALGRQPIALLISTPELCTSRVCGPVTDIVVELQHEFGRRITFIHQEVYVDNDPSKGLRAQLKAFHLETEPWLFTVNRQGIIAARLQGAFGINEARAALEAALAVS